MKKRYTEEQIIRILKQAEAGIPVSFPPKPVSLPKPAGGEGPDNRISQKKHDPLWLALFYLFSPWIG